MKLPVANGRQILKRIYALLKEHQNILIRVLFLQFGAAIAAVAVPWLMGDITDRIREGTTQRVVGIAILAALALVVAGAFFAYFSELNSRILGERVFAQLREDLVETVTNLPLSTVEEAGTGDLLGRTTRDVSRVQFMVRQGISSIVVLTTTIVVTVVAAIATSPLLSIALILPFMAVVPVMRWYIPRTIPAYRAQASAWARISGTITETIENAETIDAFNLGWKRNRRIDEAIRESWRIERYTAMQRVFLQGSLIFLVTFPVAVVLVLGAWGLGQGLVTEGQVMSVALYAMQIRGPIWEFTYWIDNLQESQAALGRIFGVSLVEPDREASGEMPDGTHLEAKDVRYAYQAGKDVLHGVNLDLTPGETLAMVGPSGAGKSTFGRMIAGIHPPTAGRVTVGGVNLVDLPEETLQEQVVLVSQEHHVFVGTIADNLRLAREHASDEDIKGALAAVGAGQWVSDLEEGLETKVGAGGMTLTPAQAQQLALARIVLMDPHTLVLDEATSLMDPTAARSLERSLAKVLDGRTVVAIAHRLYTAQDADRVAVLIDGNIAELGSHHELIAHGGEYASLWESWQRG